MLQSFSFLQEKVIQKIFFHRSITVFAEAFISGFGVMFLYQVSGEKLWVILAAYGAAALGNALLAPFSSIVFNKFQTKVSLLVGISFRVLLWLSLLLTNPDTWQFTIPLYVLSIIMIRFWYWPAFNNTLTISTRESNRTQALAFLANISNTFGLFMPLAVGYVVSLYGFTIPIFLGMLFIMISFIPLLSLKTPEVSFIWKPRDVWQNFVNKNHRTYLTAEFANGFAGAFSVVLWPIVIFIILEGDFFSIGLIASATTLVLILISTFIANIADKLSKKKNILMLASSLSAVGWMLRVIVENAFQVFAVRSYSRISNSITNLSVESLSFSYASTKTTCADELIVLREMGLNFGRTTGYIFIFCAALFIPVQYLFVFAALATLSINLIPNQQKASADL